MISIAFGQPTTECLESVGKLLLPLKIVGQVERPFTATITCEDEQARALLNLPLKVNIPIKVLGYQPNSATVKVEMVNVSEQDEVTLMSEEVTIDAATQTGYVRVKRKNSNEFKDITISLRIKEVPRQISIVDSKLNLCALASVNLLAGQWGCYCTM